MQSVASSMHHFGGTRGSAEPFKQAGFVSLQTDPCVWILPAPSPVKSVSSVDVRTKLGSALAESSVSPVPETRTDRWKRQRNVQGLLGLTFRKAVQRGLGVSLSLEPGSKVDCDFAVEN